MNSRPLAFIDVDGVLNRNVSTTAARRRGLTRTPKLFPTTIPISTRLVLDPDDKTRLTRLEAHFDLAWATTWEHDAPTLIAPLLGIGHHWPIAINTTPGGSKAPGVRDLAAGRPFVWFDDDLQPEDHHHLRDLDCLLIDVAAPYVDNTAPAVETGLTDTHIDMALSWARPRSLR